MALGNSGNKVFLSVADGKIVQRVKQDTPGAQPRSKKDGAIVYELKYSYITGVIIGIGIRKGQLNGQEIKEWQLDIVDGNENYQLQVMYDSRYATSLLFALANPVVDFSKPITLTPWMKVVNDKKKTSIYVKQGDQNIEWYFTKDNPNGLPDLIETMFKGKKVWDSYDRMQFLEKFVENKIKPQLGNPFFAADPEPAFAPDTTTTDDFLGDNAEEDDLPF